MPLADDIAALRDRTRAELAALHDYYSHSEYAWGLVVEAVRLNPGLTIQSSVTGTATAGPALAALAVEYTHRHITEATFVQFLSVFEVSVGDLLRLWLTAFPRAIGGKTVRLEDALDAGDLPGLVRQVVDHEIAEVTYKSPRKVFEYLERRVGLAVPPAAEVDRLAEARATRDVLMHNRGAVDAEYGGKAGPLARFTPGELIEVPKPYHRAVWERLLKLTEDLATAAAAKVP